MSDTIELLKGEGDTVIIRRVRTRQACENCSEPATIKLCFLYESYRSNPNSSGYRRDDCTWCSDLDVFVCDSAECRRALNNPNTYSHERFSRDTTEFNVKNSPHMFLYWKETKEQQP